MPAPTSGPYGTQGLIYNPAGVDTNPIADGWTTGYAGGAPTALRRATSLIAPQTAGNPSQAYRGGATYGPDAEMWMLFSAKGANATSYVDMTINLSSPNVGFTMYVCEVTPNAAADHWDLYRGAGGTFTLIGSGTQEFAAGDYGAISSQIVGGNPLVECWWWNTAATGASSKWVKVAGVSDTNVAKVTTGGFIGLEMPTGVTTRIGNIFGGSINPPGLVPVGGRGASW